MIIHIVKQNDNIFSIAKMYNKTIEQIAKDNGLDIAKTLVIGQSIVITEDKPKLRAIASNGYMYTNIKKDILDSFLPYLTFGSVFSYTFDKNANIKSIDDEEVLKNIKASFTKPIMVISSIGEEDGFDTNLSGIILNDIALQDKLIENILFIMRSKGYFGLDIDFEYVATENKDKYIKFLEKITKTLNNNGYPVNVSLAPKLSKNQKGLLYEAHDYEAIGEIANSILLMTYEWGYTYSKPMPTSPIDKVRLVLDYATSEIKSEKIFLGVPNYGYRWTEGEKMAKSIGNEEAIDIARENNATIEFDEKTQTPYFSYIKDGKKNIVHFEDARSIYSKFMLISEYNLAGFSYWNIMRKFTQANTVLSQLFDVYQIKS